MRADVNVDVAGAKCGPGLQLVRKNLDGTLPEIGVRTGEVDEICRVDRHRGDVIRVEALAEGRQLARRRGPPAPRGGVVREDLDRVGADLVRALDCLDHPGAERYMGTEASTVRQHSAHRTMPGRWIARPDALPNRSSGRRGSRCRR